MKVLSILVCLIGISLVGCASASPPMQGVSAPARKCEITLSSWCIVEGAGVVTRRLADDGVHDRIWSLEGRFRPDSKLFILEPNGCKRGYADEMQLLRFEKGVEWDGVSLNRAIVRIKSDRSCDLQILFLPLDGDPMEWAFSTGLGLIWGCGDKACTPTPFADIKPLLIERGVGSITADP